MSYDAWQQDYSGDPTIVGSQFLHQHQAGSIIGGLRPRGFYGDRIDTNPPK